jgi:hypothetical protein
MLSRSCHTCSAEMHNAAICDIINATCMAGPRYVLCVLCQQASPDAPSRRRLDHLSSLKKLIAGRQNKAYKQSSGDNKLPLMYACFSPSFGKTDAQACIAL